MIEQIYNDKGCNHKVFFVGSIFSWDQLDIIIYKFLMIKAKMFDPGYFCNILVNIILFAKKMNNEDRSNSFCHLYH